MWIEDTGVCPLGEALEGEGRLSLGMDGDLESDRDGIRND